MKGTGFVKYILFRQVTNFRNIKHGNLTTARTHKSNQNLGWIKYQAVGI